MKYGVSIDGSFVPWQPSSWPEAPKDWEGEFGSALKFIIDETMMKEIENVFQDVLNQNEDRPNPLAHRGHVLLVALLCAVDTLSSYAYRNLEKEVCGECGRGDGVGPRYKRFIERHFPDSYKAYAEALYKVYRNTSVHSWHLFKVAIVPGHDDIREEGGSLVFGLLGFAAALRHAIENFFEKLKDDPELQASVLKRYTELRTTAIP